MYPKVFDSLVAIIYFVNKISSYSNWTRVISKRRLVYARSSERQSSTLTVLIGSANHLFWLVAYPYQGYLLTIDCQLIQNSVEEQTRKRYYCLQNSDFFHQRRISNPTLQGSRRFSSTWTKPGYEITEVQPSSNFRFERSTLHFHQMSYMGGFEKCHTFVVAFLSVFNSTPWCAPNVIILHGLRLTTWNSIKMLSTVQYVHFKTDHFQPRCRLHIQLARLHAELIIQSWNILYISGYHSTSPSNWLPVL